MDLRHFSGVFGFFDHTELIESGSAGYADRNFVIPNDPEFSYQTASGTKGFTAAAVLSLIAAGKLRTDSPVKELLASCAGHERYGQMEWLSDTLTVRSLLAHTSGVPDYFDEDVTDDFETALNGQANYHFEKPEQFFPLEEEVWKKQNASYAPKGSFKYSNGGFVLLAAVVEAVSGHSFPDYVTEHIFKPFGMKKSGLFRMDEQAPEGVIRASAYQKNGRSNIYAVPVIGGGDGGAYTNPRDMALFWNRLDPDPDPGSPLSALISEAWTPVNDAGEDQYGLGFWISKKKPWIVFLEGFDPGVQFFSFFNRETKRSLTVCMNDENADCGEVFEKYMPFIE